MSGDEAELGVRELDCKCCAAVDRTGLRAVLDSLTRVQELVAEWEIGLEEPSSTGFLIGAQALAELRVALGQPCHCGSPVAYGFDGDPTHHRGMCERCDAVRCDAFPGACTTTPTTVHVPDSSGQSKEATK